MIKLATPISHLFLHEHIAQKIIMISDCLECRDWCLWTPYPKQELIHYDINIIHFWDKDLQRMIYSSIFSKPHLELVTFHMAASYDEPVLLNGVYQPGGNECSRRELLENARGNIAWLRSFLPDEILIGVENNNFYPSPAYRHITDSDFITQVVEENEITFLFDIAHARITALNRAIDYQTYLAALPLEHMIQIHISGHKINSDNIAYDAHELPDEGIYHEVCELAATYPVKYLTLEYYNDSEKVLSQLDRYKNLKEELGK